MIGSSVDVLVEKDSSNAPSPSSKYSMNTFDDEDASSDEESFEGNFSQPLSTTVKLPSIALADPEKARIFAANICARVQVVEAHDGNFYIQIENEQKLKNNDSV